jgi:hypothetical protein
LVQRRDAHVERGPKVMAVCGDRADEDGVSASGIRVAESVRRRARVGSRTYKPGRQPGGDGDVALVGSLNLGRDQSSGFRKSPASLIDPS